MSDKEKMVQAKHKSWIDGTGKMKHLLLYRKLYDRTRFKQTQRTAIARNYMIKAILSDLYSFVEEQSKQIQQCEFCSP